MCRGHVTYVSNVIVRSTTWYSIISRRTFIVYIYNLSPMITSLTPDTQFNTKS